MNIVIETDRLLLRTFTIEDAPLIYELNLDPDVIRFTGDPIKDIDMPARYWNKPSFRNMPCITMAVGQCM